jgi:metal-responsive CopG/Arc/MetJ family transcriptional regulator
MAETVRTTGALPAALLERVDDLVQSGAAASRSEFLAIALQREIALRERAELDAAFAHMANDAEYQEEAQQIAREFAHADWEAFQSAERDE